LKGDGHNRHRSIRSITAAASTPIGAVDALVAKLDADAIEQQQIWGETK
jgi:hypothetical protein